MNSRSSTNRLKNKKENRILARLVILGFIASFVFVGSFYFYISSPLQLQVTKNFTLEKGVTLRELAGKLEDLGVIRSSKLFFFEVRLFQNYGKFQAGPYVFGPGAISSNDIIRKMLEGDIYNELLLEYTIPEGFTQKQVIERLSNAGGAPLSAFIFKQHSLTVYGLKIPVKESLEGFLYPATYRFFNVLPTPDAMIDAMLAEFFKRLPPDYEARLSQMNLSLYEGVTFASLIEKEAFFVDEKRQISEVIWRRIKNNEPLGIDASIIYGINDYKGDLTTAHLKDSSNPYNLRLKRGLPPTPICSPTVDSLKAVLEPTNKGYYYYVLLPGSDKRHHFSTNLQEHNTYVRKLVQYQKSARK